MSDKPQKPEPEVTPESAGGEIFGHAPQVGRRLIAAREARGLTRQDVVNALKIREVQLVALEEGQYHDLPGKAYIRGFTRSYADFLGLAPDDLIAELEAAGILEETGYHELPTPVEEGLMPSPRLILLGLLAVVVLAVAWQGWRKMPIPQDEQAPVADTHPAEVPATLPHAAAVRTEATPAPDFQTTMQPAATAPAALAVPTSPTATVPPPAPVGGRVMLLATQQVWVELKEDVAGGRTLLARVMQPGEYYWLPASAVKPLLDVGLAPALTIYVDGQKLGISGIIDRRVRDLSLNPDYLKNVYFAQGLNQQANLQPKAPAATAPSTTELAPVPVAPAVIPVSETENQPGTAE